MVPEKISNYVMLEIKLNSSPCERKTALVRSLNGQFGVHSMPSSNGKQKLFFMSKTNCQAPRSTSNYIYILILLDLLVKPLKIEILLDLILTYYNLYY